MSLVIQQNSLILAQKLPPMHAGGKHARIGAVE